MRATAWILTGAICLAVVPLAAVAADASPGSDTARHHWAQWQGRLTLGTATPAWRLGIEGPGLKLSSASLMGDYYFSRSLANGGRLGGFRATSGLIIGPRGTLSAGQPGVASASGNVFSIGSRPLGQTPAPSAGDASPEQITAPYVGVGYTGLSIRSGWSFSADLGVAAQSASSAGRLGRAVSGAQSLDDAVRDMRLAPLVQFGVSYSF